MTLTIEGLGFVAEIDAAPDQMVLGRDSCGNLDFVFADFTYGAEGFAKVWVTGAQIGACLAPRGVTMTHEMGLYGERFHLSEDTIIARGPGSFNDARWTNGFRGQFLNFAPEAIERFFHVPLTRLAFKSRDIVVPAGDHPVVSHILSAVASDLSAGSPGGPMFVETLSSAALRAIVDVPEDAKKSARGLSYDQARTIRALILDHLEERLSLVDIADAVSMSVGHVLRSFKVTFGVTPHQYIIRQRVDRAIVSLKTTNMTLDEIAADCGLGTKGQMARTFRTTLGVAPTDVRNE